MGALVNAVAALVLVYTAGRLLWTGKRGLPYPPGPRLRDIDISRIVNRPWIVFTEWKRTYGPVVSFSPSGIPIVGQRMIVLNSAKAVTDLLESRSNLYSDRPVNWMLGHIAGRRWNVFSISLLDPRFKIYRRLLHAGLNARACKDYRGIQHQETMSLLKALATKPEEFAFALRRNAVAVILNLAYGLQIGVKSNDFVKLLEDTFVFSGELMTPGKYLVEFFPVLRHVPDWLPGAGFKRYGKAVGRRLERLDLIPFQWTREQMLSGKHIESYTSKLIQSETPYISPAEKDDILRWCSAALYVGGGDTMVSVMMSLMLIMQLHPEIQKRAQEDIGRVAPGRLPNLDDHKSLPYIVALIKELLRWGPVAPLGLPHSTTEDDVYEGYRIPKGSRILANIWAITHDEDMYPDPFKFDPERHLGSNPQPDPFQWVFGFGRRACPGTHFAEMSLFLNITNILAVFTISKARDSNGVELEPRVSWSHGVTSHLEPFTCQITARSQELLTLVLDHEDPIPDFINLDS